MQSEELHPVVELLLARMNTHPEEFQAGMNRWDFVLHKVLDNGNEAETTAINEGLRPIRLAEVHEWMMDELCNGDERRRKEQEELEYEKRLMVQRASSMGASLRSAISPAVQQAYDQIQKQQQLQAEIEAYRNTSTLHNTGLAATIKKALGI